MQEMSRGFSIFEEVLLVFEAWDSNVEQYKKAAGAIQNTIQCYHVINNEEKNKNSYYADITGSFLPEGYRTESRQGLEPVPSTSGVSVITACLPPPIAEDPSALPSPASSTPSTSQELFLAVQSMPPPVCQLL